MRNLAVLLALGGGVVLTAQQAVFRSTTQYVAVDAVVTDREDRLITDLTKEEFEIRENGQLQKIADFSFVSVPLGTRTVDVDAPPGPMIDVANNATSQRSSRAIVIFVDDSSLTASMRQLDSPDVVVALKNALTTFVRTLAPDDQAAIIWQSRSDVSTDFTNDTERLVAAISSRRAVLGLGSPGPAWRARVDSLKFAVAALASSGYARRAIVFVGTRACDPVMRVNDRYMEYRECRDLYDKARDANVPIYALDPRVNPPGSDHTLAELAVNTGGRAFTQQSRPVWAAEQIMLDNGSFYTLGFYPEPLVTDGKFHRIDVSVKRPGLRVRSRDRYLADAAMPPRSTPNRDMTKALAAGLDDPGIPLRAFVAPLAPALRSTRTLVTVELAYPVPQGTDSSALEDELRLGILALTPDAKIKGSFQRPIALTGKWKPTARGTFVINEVMDLPHDDLKIRVGVMSRELRRTGTTHVALDVPNYDTVDLQLSPIVLGLTGPAATRSLDAAIGLDNIRALVPFQPTTQRTFAPAESIRLFAWTYWRSQEAAVATEIRIDDRLVLERSLQARMPAPGKRSAAVDAVIPLAGLTAGKHVLTLKASVNSKRVSQRQVAIEIR